ncbi:molybdenum ABC transporter ATP-binding protein [Candidatus Tenderia electrophaga]|jgi:molybdate transport system ATP-binding protein|uniref:Molybdenum ABC transporter ATP-binding protein n=1 Tax=Candidatus Tenderia electrophaga TaxID=1748243 RepID=A0A0S2TDQ0_9GAMM|nr:molybdenum ABC transporter ATP-binding protein [Candidatus Tenderia electrophaga]
MARELKARFGLNYPGFKLTAELDAPLPGVTTLFGPSGAGKSSVLRCLAGLERSATGYVQLGDQVWQDERRNIFLPVHQRRLAYVFQEPRLFNHLGVRANLEYGYRRRPPAQRRLDWDTIIDLLALGPLLARRPQHLSLGEQQRVAIGRALLASPQLLLMDEPLASLDMARKREVLPFIKRLHDELQMPVVYVSHSLHEVLQITDTLVLMQNGRSIASGPLAQLCSELTLSQYLGDMSGSVLETRVDGHEIEFGLTRLSFAGGHLYVPLQPNSPGESLRVHVLARNVGIALQQPQATTSFLNILPATVTQIDTPDISGHEVHFKLDIGVPLLANISRKSQHSLRLEPGQRCYALIKAVSLVQNATLTS